uniref:Major capsid protein n=1 Tax=Rhizobium phage IG49 TaxID=3129228 RepID=A0AAU8HYG4_9CAUD
MSTKEFKALAYKDRIVLADISAPGDRTPSTFLSGDGTFRKAPIPTMEADVYDPTGVAADAFSLENMKETDEIRLFHKAEKEKLSAIDIGATKNRKDVDLLDRKNHTGKQTIETIENLKAALDEKFSSSNPPAVGSVSGLSAVINAMEESIAQIIESALTKTKKLTTAEKLVALDAIGALPHPTGNKTQVILGDGTVATIDRSLVGLGKVENISPLEMPVSDFAKRLLDRKIGDEGGAFKGQIFNDFLPDPAWLRKGTFFARSLPVQIQNGFMAASPFRSYAIHDKASFAPGIGFDYVHTHETSKVEGSYQFGTMRKLDGVPGMTAGEFRLHHQDAYGLQWNSLSFNGATGEVGSTGPSKSPLAVMVIDHPADPANSNLVMASVISNEALITFRGKAKLVKGVVTVDVEKSLGLKKNTLASFWADPAVSSVHPVDSFDKVKTSAISGNSFTITSENAKSTDEVNWTVTARRADAVLKWQDFKRTNEEGKLIVEEEKV